MTSTKEGIHDLYNLGDPDPADAFNCLSFLGKAATPNEQDPLNGPLTLSI